MNANGDAAGPIVFINVFTVKAGSLDAFVTLQKANLERSRGNVRAGAAAACTVRATATRRSWSVGSTASPITSAFI